MGEDRCEHAGLPGQPNLTKWKITENLSEEQMTQNLNPGKTREEIARLVADNPDGLSMRDIRPKGTPIDQVPWSSWMTGRPYGPVEIKPLPEGETQVEQPAEKRSACAMKLNAKVAVGMMIQDLDDKILIIHKIGRFWELPGGKLEPGETLAEAADREAREETGLKFTTRGIIGVYSNREADGQTMLFIFFNAFALRGPENKVVLEAHRHDAHKWVSREELASIPDLAPRLKHLVTCPINDMLFDRQVTDEYC
jgi:8-oxo-dGTP diphosphatase